MGRCGSSSSRSLYDRPVRSRVLLLLRLPAAAAAGALLAHRYLVSCRANGPLGCVVRRREGEKKAGRVWTGEMWRGDMCAQG